MRETTRAAPSAEAAAPTPVDRVGLVILCGIVVALNVGKIPPTLPAVREELMLGLVAAGVVVSALNAFGALSGGFVGVLVDRWGPRRLLSGALLAAAAGNGLGALGSDLAWLIAGRVLEGLAFILVLSAAPVLLNRLAAPRDRGLVMGFWGTFLPVGSAIAILIAPPVLHAADWRALWRLLMALSLLVFALYWAREVRAPAPAGHVGARFADLAVVLRAPAVVFLGLVFGAFSFIFGSVLSFLPLWLNETEGLAVAAGSAAALAMSAGNVVGNLTGGALLRHGVSAWRLIAVASIAIGVLALTMFAPGLPIQLRITAAIVMGTVGGWIPASTFATAPRLAPTPQLAGAATGVVVQILNVGTVLGPLAVSAAAEATGSWTIAGGVLAAAAGVCLLAAFGVRPRVLALDRE